MRSSFQKILEGLWDLQQDLSKKEHLKTLDELELKVVTLAKNLGLTNQDLLIAFDEEG